MDNVTHTLAGLVVAEVALHLRSRWRGRSLQSTSADRPRGSDAGTSLSRAAWLASAGANNAPDLDFLYAGVVERPLGYLLHHRGHTHTLALAPFVALLAFAAAVALERWSARRANEAAPDRSSWPFLYGLAVLGCVTHIAMDATNNYGVHPFWPIDSRWMYGDTIFIVEPLWWVVLGAPLAFTARSKVGRALFALPPIAAVVLAITSGVVLPPFVAVLGALTPLLLVLGARLSRPTRAWLALGLGLLVPMIFAASGASARGRASERLAAVFPDATLHDLVLTPMPGNPFCWSALAVEADRTSLVYLRLAVSTWPEAMSAEGCHTDPPRETLAPRVPVHEGSTVDVQLFDTLTLPLGELRALAADDCRVAAFAAFSRAPFVVEADGTRVLGDARYDMSRGLSWSKMALPGGAPRCPELLPRWDWPRADVLR